MLPHSEIQYLYEWAARERIRAVERCEASRHARATAREQVADSQTRRIRQETGPR